MNWLAPGSDAPGEVVGEIRVNIRSSDELLEAVESDLSAGSGFSVATINLDHVVKLRNSAAFRDAYARHTYVTADGNPIVWLSRLSGETVSLAAGSDLVDPLCALAARLGAPVGFFGSTEESLSGAAEELTARHPGLQVAARISPPMGFDPTGEAAERYVRELEAAGVRICLVALGAPKQELFAAYGQTICPTMGFVSIGAGLDFLSGHQTRAPGAFRAVGAEWIWRLGSDPKRLGSRYAACLGVMPGLTIEAMRRRGKQPE